ncbi:MAG TPA: hypothetical protein VFP48_01880 [Steroidobacteraceae bacterium]|nr:hypothetical protein [Steroidobacteraceae bacterium]
MKFRLVGIAAVLALLATACIPGIPILAPKRPPQPASEVARSAALEPRDGAGAIVITRDDSLLRTKCTYEVTLDGEVMAGLRTNEYVTLYADPGARTLRVVIRPDGNCKPALAELPLKVVANATTTIRIVADTMYDLRIEATTY